MRTRAVIAPLLALIFFFVSSASNAQLRPNCAATQVNETQQTLIYVKEPTRTRIPVCFEDQYRALAAYGFGPRIESLSLRIFVLEQMLEQTSVFAKGLKSLMASGSPEDRKIIQEISQLTYVADITHISKEKFVNSPTTYLDGGLFHMECGQSNEGCALRVHIQSNISLIQKEQRAKWVAIASLQMSGIALQEGKIPDGALGSKAEKDFTAAEVAVQIRELRPSLDAFSVDEKKKIQALADIYETSTSEFYAGDNQNARELQVHSMEFTLRPFLQMRSLDDVIRNEIFAESFWRGGAAVASIKAEDSLSPLRILLGAGSSRVVFWPWGLETEANGIAADLHTLRISQMIDAAGVVRSIEVIARDFFKGQSAPNDGWQPFVYEKHWGRWFPAQTIRSMPVKDFCIKCHVSSTQLFSPYPRNVHDAAGFAKIGYKNPKIIQEFMGYAQ